MAVNGRSSTRSTDSKCIWSAERGLSKGHPPALLLDGEANTLRAGVGSSNDTAAAPADAASSKCKRYIGPYQAQKWRNSSSRDPEQQRPGEVIQAKLPNYRPPWS